MIMMNKSQVNFETEASNEKDIYNTDSQVEADNEEDSLNTDDDDNNDTGTNAGWVDSIAKILKTNKPKGKKTLVLSKAKKLTDVKSKPKDAGFEVLSKDGCIKEEQIQEDSEDSETEQPLRKKKKELPNLRIKPNILHKDRERVLTKIATKGVVQLFNAVKKQQKDIDTKLTNAGSLEVKRDKVLKNIDKREFLNVLMGDKTQTVTAKVDVSTNKNKQKPCEKPTWTVLQDDFMMSAKMKDWDKELESENDIEEELIESE